VFGNDERAGPARRPEVTIFAVPLLVYFFGRIVRSAIARNIRAISSAPASPLQARSCSAERISASMISTARSFWLRLASPVGTKRRRRAHGVPWALTIARPSCRLNAPKRIQLSRRNRSASYRWTIDLLSTLEEALLRGYASPSIHAR